MLPDFDRADRIGAYWATPGIRVERGEAQCLRLPRRSFQDEIDDRERSDYYGDDDDDPDADGSDHPTTPRHHKPPTRLCETLTRTGLELLTARLRDLTAKTHPRRTPDRLRGGRGAPGPCSVGMVRDADGRLKEAAEPTVSPPHGQPESRNPVLFQTFRGDGGLAAGFGMIVFPPVLGLVSGFWSSPRLVGLDDCKERME
jgi:hypothetical protein